MNDPQVFLDMLKNKELMMGTLMTDLDVCSQNMQAFDKLAKLYDENPDSVSVAAALKAASKSLRHINDLNRRLIMMLLVYGVSDSFSSDTAKLLVKMGRGEDALREMFKQKMSGR